MSELKAYIAPTPDGAGLADYYLKSEADKVIADLEESHRREVDQLLMTILELKEKLDAPQLVMRLNTTEALYSNLETMSRLTHEKYTVERRELHQKYKRCLAMAKWCDSENYTACWYHENSERCKWTEKWHKRWLELAEKFKEAK